MNVGTGALDDLFLVYVQAVATPGASLTCNAHKAASPSKQSERVKVQNSRQLKDIPDIFLFFASIPFLTLIKVLFTGVQIPC